MFLIILPLSVNVMPKASSKHLTDAIVCPVGQTPHILCVIWGASLGSLVFRIFSNPRKSVPLEFASVILPLVLTVIVHLLCPSILVKGSMIIVAIFYLHLLSSVIYT